MLKRWREDTGAEKTPFAGWLEKQSMSAVDRALIRERIPPASKINTEALAHLEGFIAGFPVEAKDVKEGAHRVYENELKEAARHWVASDKAVQAEFITRLKALKARLKGERLEHAGRRPQGPQGRRQVLRAAGRRRPGLTARWRVDVPGLVCAANGALLALPGVICIVHPPDHFG